MTRSAVAVCVVVTLAGLGATARDSFDQRPTPGTARVSGVVVTTSDPPAPVRRAVVKLSGAGEMNRSAITDDQGRFAFAALPAGRFALTASKPAYVTTAYGAKGAGRTGTVLSIAAGQSLTDLRVVLPRGAVITGTIRDSSGEPAPDVQVVAIRAALVGGVATNSEVDAIRADDRGMYRIYGLAPGDYVVAAAPYFLGGGETGRMTRDEIDTQLRALQQRASGSAAAAPAPPVRRYNLANVFYPSTSIPAQATRITLTEGAERRDIDISLVLVPTATVSGVVVGPSGQPESTVALTITQAGPPMPFSFGMGPDLTTRPGADGAFRYTNVAPGTYTLWARSTAQVVRTAGSATTSTGRASDLPPGQVLWASAEFTVAGDDVNGVSLRLRPALMMTGRVTFDRQTIVAPSNLTQVRITLGPPPQGSPDAAAAAPGPAAATPPSVTAQADGTFEIRGLLPGAYGLTGYAPNGMGPAGWWLRSAVVGGRDLLDGPIEIGDADLTGVVVTFSDRHTELSGMLQTAAGQPAPDYVVVAFPDDRALWRAARRLQAARPATDGRFSFVDLPPGTYLLAALTDLDEENWRTPDALGQTAPAGVRVTISEGEKRTQDLRVAR